MWHCRLMSGISFLGSERDFMSRVVKRSGAEATETGRPRRPKDAALPLPRWIPPQLCQPVETAPSGPQWLHEIKLDGFRMAALCRKRKRTEGPRHNYLHLDGVRGDLNGGGNVFLTRFVFADDEHVYDAQLCRDLSSRRDRWRLAERSDE